LLVIIIIGDGSSSSGGGGSSVMVFLVFDFGTGFGWKFFDPALFGTLCAEVEEARQAAVKLAREARFVAGKKLERRGLVGQFADGERGAGGFVD